MYTQTTLEQADTTQQEEGAEPDVAMETGVVAVEMAEDGGGDEGARDDDEQSGSQNDEGKFQ